MCLIVNKGAYAKRAETDIECYKVIRKHWSGEYYVTHFREVPLDDDVLRGEKPFEAVGYSCDGYERLTAGYIHTYGCSLWSLRENFYNDRIKFYEPDELVVYRCVIPAGTLYFVGQDTVAEVESYASKQIIFKERVL